MSFQTSKIIIDIILEKFMRKKYKKYTFTSEKRKKLDLSRYGKFFLLLFNGKFIKNPKLAQKIKHISFNQKDVIILNKIYKTSNNSLKFWHGKEKLSPKSYRKERVYTMITCYINTILEYMTCFPFTIDFTVIDNRPFDNVDYEPYNIFWYYQEILDENHYDDQK